MSIWLRSRCGLNSGGIAGLRWETVTVSVAWDAERRVKETRERLLSLGRFTVTSPRKSVRITEIAAALIGKQASAVIATSPMA